MLWRMTTGAVPRPGRLARLEHRGGDRGQDDDLGEGGAGAVDLISQSALSKMPTLDLARVIWSGGVSEGDLDPHVLCRSLWLLRVY